MMLMLDLQKDFDTVDHEILGKKLKAMGVESVDWFMSYLSNRNQLVHINNTPDPSHVTSGVTQGSSLGPFLFLSYVNDMEVSMVKPFVYVLRVNCCSVLATVQFYTHMKILR